MEAALSERVPIAFTSMPTHAMRQNDQTLSESRNEGVRSRAVSFVLRVVRPVISISVATCSLIPFQTQGKLLFH